MKVHECIESLSNYNIEGAYDCEKMLDNMFVQSRSHYSAKNLIYENFKRLYEEMQVKPEFEHFWKHLLPIVICLQKQYDDSDSQAELYRNFKKACLNLSFELQSLLYSQN